MGSTEMFTPTFSLADTKTFVGPSWAALNYASIQGIGDFNGDGYSDFVCHEGQLGMRVLFGDGNLAQETLLADASLIYTHSGGNNQFGFAVLRSTDLDDDGQDELIFSNAGEDLTAQYSNNGAVLGFWGGTQTGVFDDSDTADFQITGDSGQHLGYGLASGHVDGDGLPDLWIASSNHELLLMLSKNIQ